MPCRAVPKGGINMLTKCIATDHAADGIRCNAICPGTIETDDNPTVEQLAASVGPMLL